MKLCFLGKLQHFFLFQTLVHMGYSIPSWVQFDKVYGPLKIIYFQNSSFAKIPSFLIKTELFSFASTSRSSFSSKLSAQFEYAIPILVCIEEGFGRLKKKDLFLILVMLNIRKNPYEKLSFSRNKLQQKSFRFGFQVDME